MSQYNTQPDSTAENARFNEHAPELAPFLPTMNQSGGRNPPHHHAGTGPAKAGLPRCEPLPLPRLKATHAATQHSRIESRNSHTCAACSASFPNNHQLEQHATKKKHKAYLCTCGQGFTKLSALRRHIDETTQAREHQCPLCDHEFKRPGHVEQHLRLIHKKRNDVIKNLLDAQKSQRGRESGPASTASTNVPAAVYVSAQAHYPIANPGEPWAGPIDCSAPAPVPASADYPAFRPVDSSAFLTTFSASGPGHMTEAPVFVTQDFMTQAPNILGPLADPAGAVAAQPGFPADPAPDFVGCPAAHSEGNLDLLNINPASISVNPFDGFEMPALGHDFMWELFGSNFKTFDL